MKPSDQALAKPLRNLLMVHTAPFHDLSDWLEVKRRIEESAPDIEVRIIDNRAPDPKLLDWQVSRPSLVFSTHWLLDWQPKGGKVYQGAYLSKLEQVERLAGKGLPVPPTLKLTRDLDFNRGDWGEFVIAKPQYSARGMGVCLVKREDIADRYDEITLNGTREMIVQPYIEHGANGYPTDYRVLTLFGKVIYSTRSSWGMPRRQLEEIALDRDGIIASNSVKCGRVRQVWNDPEIIALGERAHIAFPECPALGIDILREVETRKLYVMEVNPRGPWHMSSGLAKREFPEEHRRDLYAQFNALERVAHLLIERTRVEAA